MPVDSKIKALKNICVYYRIMIFIIIKFYNILLPGGDEGYSTDNLLLL